MSYLVDSDYVVDWLRGTRAATRLMADLREDGIAISLMTYGEIYEGIYRTTDPQAAEAVFLRFLREVPVLPFNRAIMRVFARISRDLHGQGQHIGDADILIAATAIHHGLTLLTRNRRHFERIEGLQLHDSVPRS